MDWSIWKTFQNIEIIQNETKKELLNMIIKDLENFNPLNYPPNTIDNLIEKYKELLKNVDYIFG